MTKKNRVSEHRTDDDKEDIHCRRRAFKTSFKKMLPSRICLQVDRWVNKRMESWKDEIECLDGKVNYALV